MVEEESKKEKPSKPAVKKKFTFKRSGAKRKPNTMFLIIVNILLILLGVYWLEYLGILNIKNAMYPFLLEIPVVNKIMPGSVEDPYLIQRMEWKKKLVVLKSYESELEVKKKELDEKENELKNQLESLKEERASIKKKEELLEKKQVKYDDYKKNVDKQADYFTQMPPEKAVSILNNMDDLLVIDILRRIEEKAAAEDVSSIVPYLLTLMDAERASKIQRKMTQGG